MLDQNLLARTAYKLQPLPPSLTRLAALVAQQEPDLREVVKIVAFDPVLTGKLLHVANSAYSGSRTLISTAKEAVIRLGSGAVLRLVVGVCARPLLQQAIPAYGLSKGELWRHSTAAALAAEALGGFTGTPIPPATFTAALLHDLGKLVLGPMLTPELGEALRRAIAEGGAAPHQAEIELLSVHHGEVGGLIAQHWKLPEVITEAITHHHTPEAGDTAACYAAHLANAVAHCVAEDWDAEALERSGVGQSREWLGISVESFGRLCETVAKRFGAVKEQFQ